MLVDSTGNSGAASTVTGAIRGAAQASGASFEYMLTTAQIESGFNPHAAASTSSAGGLYQFIDQTWLGMLKDAGPSLGYGRYADAITKSPSGHFEVTDPAMRQEIMALRKDPTANAAMAGAFTQQNSSQLASQLGRNPSDGELYIAHFLGPAGAGKLITAASTSPQASASAIFPSAASANHSIFYDKQGNARSVSDVYGVLVHRYDSARAAPTPTNTDVALNAPPIPPADIPVSGAVGSVGSAPGSGVNTAAGIVGIPPVLPASFDAATSAAAPSAGTAPFHAMFRTGEHHGGINPVVQELWGSRSGSLTSDPTPSSSSASPSSSSSSSSLSPPPPPIAGVASKSGMLNLFSDQPANVRALFGSNS
jgi:hypothetical protein